MFSRTGSTRKQSDLRRLLHMFCVRTNNAPRGLSAALVMLAAANVSQLHLLDAAHANQLEAPTESYARAYSRLGARIAVQPDDVVKDGVVIGRDPDPFIREEMLRHYGVGGP